MRQPDDLDRFDAVFEAWFGEELPRTVQSSATEPRPAALPEDETAGGEGGDAETIHALASTEEVLRHRDVADLSHAEKAQVNRLLGRCCPRVAATARPSAYALPAR